MSFAITKDTAVEPVQMAVGEGGRFHRRYQIFGIDTSLESDSQEFLKFADESLAFYRAAGRVNPPLISNVQLRLSVQLHELVDPSTFVKGAEQIGVNAYLHDGAYRCVAGRLAMEFRWDSGTLTVTAHLTTGSTWLGRWKRLMDRRWVSSGQDYFLFVRHLVFFPVFWALARYRDIFVVHGAAINRNNRTVAMVGLAGVGKTTSSLALTLDGRGTFLTDNYLLLDAERVYPFPEWVRLTARTRQSLAHVDRLGEPRLTRFGRAYYRLPEELVSAPVPIDVVLLPRLGDRTALSPLTVPVALDRILLLSDQSRELHRHHPVGLIDLLQTSETSVYSRMVETVQAWVSRARVFDVVIDRRAPVAESLEQVLADAV